MLLEFFLKKNYFVIMHFPLASIIMKYNQDWMGESGTH